MEQKNTESKTHEYEIDLKFFVTVLKKCWYWLLLAALVVGLTAGVVSSFFIPRKYSSTVNTYVDPNAQSSSGLLNSTTADALYETYPPVLRYSDEFARSVALEMALLTDENGEPMFPTWTYESTVVDGETVLVPLDWERVRDMMTTGIKDSKIFYITMRSTDPQEAFELAKIAKRVAPEVLNDKVGVGTVKVLGDPVLDTAADSPNVLRNIALAAAVAVVLVYIAFFLRDLFDTTIYSAEALEKFDLPLLGTVPSFPLEEERDRKPKREVTKA